MKNTINYGGGDKMLPYSQLLISAFILALSSCMDVLEVPAKNEEVPKPSVQSLEKAYTPEAMKASFDSVKAIIFYHFPNARLHMGPEPDFSANKKYIRFLPKDSAEYNLLMADTALTLFPHPIGNRPGSDSMSEPANEAGFSWLYTVVPMRQSLPEVPHELLEEVLLVDIDKSQGQTQANARGLSQQEYEDQMGMLLAAELYSLYQTGNLDEQEADELLAVFSGQQPVGSLWKQEEEPGHWYTPLLQGFQSVGQALASALVQEATAAKR
ncbi:MAG: hypothetical protein HC842_02705 [Cytophagales bacterium]|nr:hypothetical protein [Cytophagales bacterium]